MFCTKCGHVIEEGSTFCTNCGAPVEEGGPVAATGNTAPQPAVRAAQVGGVSGQQRVVSAASTERKQLPTGAIIGIVVGALVVVVLIVLLATGVFAGSGGSSSKDESQQTSSSAKTVTSDSSSSSSSSSGSSEITVRTSLADYSWDELGRISDEVSAASSESAAATVLKKYNLLDSSGKLTTASKSINLTDGTTLAVQLVGYYHDSKAAGSGKAGLTFITKDCYGTHAMNTSATNSGGWSGSEMRSWLNSTVLNTFPSEVKDQVVSVSKLTNNTGQTQSTSAVTSTSDKLFLFSWPEMLGTVSWNAGASTSYIDAVVNAEGTQYQLFQQGGVAGTQESDTSGLLRKALISGGSTSYVSWWTRSSTPNRADGFGDIDNGGVDNGGVATASQGVVFGFCI